MPEDWFRKASWSRDDEREFFMRLREVRGTAKTAQLLRLQAYTLARTREERWVRAALGLLALLFDRYPDPTELASAHMLAAQCHDALSEVEPALSHFRAALRAQGAEPGFDPGTAVELAWFVASRKLAQLYDQALGELDRVRLDSPLQRFKAEAVRAFVAESRGEGAAAAEHAREALAAAAKRPSRFRIRGRQGLVGAEYQPVIEQLRLLA
jgi:tetratricopeptide (TPR) repeat protein